MAKFKVTLSIGLNGRQEEVIEIPDADLEGLSESEREELLDREWKDWSGNFIDGGICAIDEEDES